MPSTALIFKQKRLTFGSQTKVCFHDIIHFQVYKYAVCVSVKCRGNVVVLFKLGLKVLELSYHLFKPRRGDFKLRLDRLHGLQYPP